MRAAWPGRSSTRLAGPAKSSASLLLRRIAQHADTQFGRDHDFGAIRTAADFRRRVPITTYDYLEPYIDRVRNGDLNALFGRWHGSLDVRDDVGDDESAQDDPRHARIAPRLSRGMDDLGHHGLRRPLPDPPLRAAADPPVRQRLAGNRHARRHPLRRDHRPDRPHAEPAGPDDVLHAGGRVADQGHRIEVLSRPAVLGLSRPGHGHRRQSQHHPGHGPARRPRESRTDPRPVRRHDRRPMGHRPGDPPLAPVLDPHPSQASGSKTRADRRSDRPTPSRKTTGPTSNSCRTGWAGP